MTEDGVGGDTVQASVTVVCMAGTPSITAMVTNEDVQSAAGLEPSWALGCRNGVACSDDSLFGAALDVAKAADQLVVVKCSSVARLLKRLKKRR